ncbi:MAG: hypothetical protein C3F14_09685 [Deltaproteobacteria bacterium]|nr:MAG: hypothetical protein C3F14_09685 [Deltaproteobacteria bacterium]
MSAQAASIEKKAQANVAEARASAGARLFFVDNIRIFLTILVILHHLMVIYAGTGDFPYKEGREDEIVNALGGWFCAVNQSYFMGLFLLVSAYFVPGSYDRKGAGRFVKDRLIRLGIPEYAILEAGGIDRVAIRKAIGLPDGGAPGLIRYLAGDLRGAIRETSNVPNDPATVELIDRLQFPLAPDYLGDCDRKKSGVDPLVLHSVIRQESQFQYNALSPAGAVGLMQLMPRTASEVARKEKLRKPRRKDLLKPQTNVALGAAYLSRLIRDFGGDYLRAIAAYNAGEKAVSKWWSRADGDPALFLETVAYRETRFYLRRIFLNVLQYYMIYRPKMFARYFPIVPGEAAPALDVPSSPPTGETSAGRPGGTAPGGSGPSFDGTYSPLPDYFLPFPPIGPALPPLPPAPSPPG